MDKQSAINALKRMFRDQEIPGSGLCQYRITTVTVWRTRGGTKHRVWLMPVIEDGELRIVDVSCFVAGAVGEKFDPDSGGVVCVASWSKTEQKQKLEIVLGFKIIENEV